MWPELGFHQQKKLKKKCSVMEKQVKDQKK